MSIGNNMALYQFVIIRITQISSPCLIVIAVDNPAIILLNKLNANSIGYIKPKPIETEKKLYHMWGYKIKMHYK